MRSAPRVLVSEVINAVAPSDRPDAILCSDMLDLPTWLGLAARKPELCWILDVPIVTYFHENQWAYPVSPDARPDHHFGYTNFLTAIASDRVWFNSDYNRSSFLEASRDFLRRMPDYSETREVTAIEQKSRVIAPGFDPPPLSPRRNSIPRDRPTRIGWVGRFEHDKRPDRFAELMQMLTACGFDFQLVLLGQRGRRTALADSIRSTFESKILFDGYAENREDYWRWLGEIDVVVSTADHEFFGISICEAIWAGCLPVVPNKLSYVEYVPDVLRYDTSDQACQIISNLGELAARRALSELCRSMVADYRSETVVSIIDKQLARTAEH